MQLVDLEISDRVARVTINRPEVMNALNPQAKWELSEALDQIEQDDDIWIAVITGAGDRAFSAGRDLKHTARMQDADPSEREEQARMEADARPLTTRWQFPKPVICRMNGLALGGGFELALACDVIIAVDQAEVGLPEPRRGLIAGGVGVHRLVRQAPLKAAMGYLLTGRHMSAQRAFELGLINAVVPAADLDAEVDSWVEDILRCAPLAIRATKEAAMRGLDSTLAQAQGGTYEWEVQRRNSVDAREGPRAFAEKRTPRWQGR